MKHNIPVQFELPRDFVSDVDEDYVPSPAHDEAEAAERAKHPGTLVLKQQLRGARVASWMFDFLAEHDNPEDVKFGMRIISSAAFGSARYSLRGGRPVMRRNLVLPIVADPETDERLERDEIHDTTRSQLNSTSELASRLYRRALNRNGAVPLYLSHRFGRTAGETALWVALRPFPDVADERYSTREVQQDVRQIGMSALATMRNMGELLGTNPSLAMLGASPTSILSVYMDSTKYHATNNAFRRAHDAADLLDRSS